MCQLNLFKIQRQNLLKQRISNNLSFKNLKKTPLSNLPLTPHTTLVDWKIPLKSLNIHFIIRYLFIHSVKILSIIHTHTPFSQERGRKSWKFFHIIALIDWKPSHISFSSSHTTCIICFIDMCFKEKLISSSTALIHRHLYHFRFSS